ncbi:MAG: dockerin type I repeat-containing protein, partial [Planctomycetes bacterium]|nr:dockerin type I repeat-containing protein [Planctomycetota bacterium]
DFCARQVLNVSFTEIEDLRNSFLRGDVNSDGKMDIADPINVVNYLFRSGTAPSCEDAADANDDSNVDVTDVMLMINHQFRAGEAPSAPFPSCGRDGDSILDDDGLGCDSDTQRCSCSISLLNEEYEIPVTGWLLSRGFF